MIALLDISAEWLLQLTWNLKLWSQDFSFDEKKGDNLYQVGKQRERNDQKTEEFNSDTSRTWEQEKTPIVNQSWIELTSWRQLSSVCPVIDHEFCHYILKVTVDLRGDSRVTKFIVYNTAGAWKKWRPFVFFLW